MHPVLKHSLLILCLSCGHLLFAEAGKGNMFGGGHRIDAVTNLENNLAIFFSGSKMIYYNIDADSAAAYQPLSLPGQWPTPFSNQIDAAALLDTFSILLISGSQYLLVDSETLQVHENYPKPLSDLGLPKKFLTGIDSAVHWQEGIFYLFKGPEFVKIKFDGWVVQWVVPGVITEDTWPHLWHNGIDAVLNYGNENAYFFQGQNYIKYDIRDAKPKKRFPKTVTEANWPGISSYPKLKERYFLNGEWHNAY